MASIEIRPLGAAFARCLLEGSGIVAAYFPEGVSISFLESVVRQANFLRPGEPPFAILVHAEDNDFSDGSCPKMKPETAIKYRQGSRLAVKVGAPPDLMSFAQVFRPVLDSSFPSSSSSSLTIESIARASIQEVLDACGIPLPPVWGRDLAVSRLECCFEDLKAAYEALGQGSLAWNVYWFDHLDRGLERLIGVLRDMQSVNPSLSLDDFFSRYTYPSFALPAPAGDGGLAQGRKVGKEIADALTDWWSDESCISSTVDALAAHPDTTGDRHAISALSWVGFSRTVASFDNLLLAFACHCPDGRDLVEAFSALTERQFFNPLSIDRENQALFIRGSSGESLKLGESQDCFVVGAGSLNIGDVVFEVDSELVTVTVPWLDSGPSGTVDAATVAESQITLSAVEVGIEWHGSAELLEDGSIGLVGLFNRISSIDPRIKPTRLFTVSLSIPDGDPLKGVVAHRAVAIVFLAPPVDTGVAVFRRPAGNGRLSFIVQSSGGDSAETDIGEESVIDLEAGREYLVAAWGSDSLEIDGLGQAPWPDRSGYWLGNLHAANNHVVVAGSVISRFTVPESSESTLSPLVAAMTGSKVSEDPPSLGTQTSIRGQVESLIAERCDSNDWLHTMGHIVLASDRDADLRSLEIAGGGFLIPAGIAEEWSQSQFGFRVSGEVLESEQAAEFRRTFTNLQQVHPMARGFDGTTVRSWPSRVSWAKLWQERAVLAEYLNAYSQLVSFAKSTGDPAAVFWASYPFSISVWANSGEGCDAVLLSPLHPLRLAWLAASEWVLLESKEPALLGGTIEGWNLPLLGPRDSPSGRMIAVPLENGEDQIFLGWSMLVRVSIDAQEPLKPPTRILGFPSPGASASGLNASSVESAVRDYRRVNPHVSTLTVDLAATEKVVRTSEVDSAVLAASGVLDGDNALSHLRGGIRVLDSLHRLGESPRDEISAVLAKHAQVPISWSRYAPSDRTESCNLRILQDSGVRVSVANHDGRNSGVVGEVPIRRFDSAPTTIRGAAAWSSPTLSSGQGWEPFTHAIRQIEDADSQPVVKSQLYRALLVDKRSDWTVSGESLVSPAAMAKLVGAGSSGEQMLWEWRPPFLAPASKSGAAVLERRPYVSVVRVPNGFRAQIRDMLSSVLGHECSEESVSSLLATLGSKGVGLSSLTTMGGTHAAGAIGFYLAMSLMEHVQSENADQFLLPLDACDGFLRALGGGAVRGESSQRADLMVIRIFDDKVVLCPIEIKFYGFLAAEPPDRLPSLGDSKLTKSMLQLQATQSVLERVAQRSCEVTSDPSSGDSRLWANGLSTLMDAAVRLSNSDLPVSHSLPDRLQNLANGRSRVVVGRPVVCFFGYNATAERGENFRSEVGGDNDASPEVGLLAANPGSVLSSIEAKSGALLDAWNAVINWASEVSVMSSSRSHDGSETVLEAKDGATETKHEQEGTPEGRSPISNEDSRFTEVVEDHVLEDEDDTSSVSRDEVADGIRFKVGDLLGSVGAASADFWPSNTDLSQMNVGVVGNLGTGKTQLLKALMFNLRSAARKEQNSPMSMLVFDYKRDYQDEDFLKSVGGSVLHVERIPLNVFSLDGPYSPLRGYQKARGFVDVLTKIYGGIGPVQINNLTSVITDLFTERAGEPPTLSDVLERYKQVAGQLDAVVSVLNPFVLGEIFSDSADELQPFETLLNDRVVVVALSDLGIDQSMKNALVVLLLNQYYAHMLKQQKWPFITNADGVQLRRLNSFLLVDEATQIMQYEFDVLMDLMLQGREFGTGVILSSQYLSHFKVRGTNYGEPLLTWFIHNVPAVTKQQLTALGITSASDEVAGRIPKLDRHQALYRSLGNPGAFIRGTPFYEMDKSQ